MTWRTQSTLGLSIIPRPTTGISTLHALSSSIIYKLRFGFTCRRRRCVPTRIVCLLFRLVDLGFCKIVHATYSRYISLTDELRRIDSILMMTNWDAYLDGLHGHQWMLAQNGAPDTKRTCTK